MKYRPAFTLVELIIVMTIFAIVAGLITVNLIKPQTSASVDSSVGILMSDVKAQQIKSMVGDTSSLSAAQNFGIFFESNKYTLFSGSSYDQFDTKNFVVDLEPNISISNNLFPPNTIIFSRRSGEVNGYVGGSNTLTIQNAETAEQKNLTINRLGTLSVN